MEWIVGGATFLGGLAALWYFWDKIQGFFRRTVEGHSQVQPEVRWVDSTYPADSGIQRRMEEQGHTFRWSREDRLARRVDLEGWEIDVPAHRGRGSGPADRVSE